MPESRASLDKGAGIFGVCFYSGWALPTLFSVSGLVSTHIPRSDHQTKSCDLDL